MGLPATHALSIPALAALALGLAPAIDPLARGESPRAEATAPVRGGPPPAVAPSVRVATFLSKTYLVDRKYRSMMGPQSTQPVTLLETETPELLWVTGFRAEMVGPDGQSPLSQEFMCHSNLDLNMSLHRRLFGMKRPSPNRVFTLSQGQQEIRFPAGFGMPIVSSEPFSLTTQVLNHNLERASFEVRHRVTVEFARDAELGAPLKPLFPLAANGLVLVEGKDPYFDIPEADAQVHGSGCQVGQTVAGSGHDIPDRYGRRFSSHWIVKPGREVNHSNITRFMNVPFDTTAHYIAVHLHPFAESLELRDLTEGVTVYRSLARNSPDRIGLDAVQYYSSEEGLKLHADHEYELVSVYNNTTSEDHDSMAVMYIYALDKEFRRPEL